MALDSVHPQYAEHRDEWDDMRNTYKGEGAIKAAGTKYLPATKGMQLDGMGVTSSNGSKLKPGQEAYNAYRIRAIFHEYVKEAVEAYIGVMHQKDATIELPPNMEKLRDSATLQGESLLLLLRRINEEQLVTGRCGLLIDLPLTPDPANPLPYIALYVAESIRNWDDGEINEGLAKLNLVVLDESGMKRDNDFQWNVHTKFRVLEIAAPEAIADGEQAQGKYLQGVFEVDGSGTPTYVPSEMKPPMLRGQTLDDIPFVFVNTKDIVPTPDTPPLLRLARLALAIYRGEADYRQNLFMQGQDTLVITGDRKKPLDTVEGEDEALRTGAGSVIELEQGGTAQYVGVEGQGLVEQRSALENDHKRAETRSGQLIDTSSGDKESGEALKVRVAAQTATLNQIAKTGAAALEAVLRKAAVWMGEDPEKVKVTPNLEFANFEMSGKNLVDLMTARTMGAPISKQSIHALMVDKGLTELDYETEKELIGQEDAESGLGGTGAGGNPPTDDPNNPPTNQA